MLRVKMFQSSAPDIRHASLPSTNLQQLSESSGTAEQFLQVKLFQSSAPDIKKRACQVLTSSRCHKVAVLLSSCSG